MSRAIRSAHSAETDSAKAAAEVADQIRGASPAAVVVFMHRRHDSAAIARALREAAPEAEIIGCTGAGELTESAYTDGGVAALALPAAKVPRCAGAIASFERGVEQGVRAATDRIAARLGVDLRAADPKRYVGVVLIASLTGHEEEVNRALGEVAPWLSFVGGSAANSFEGKETRVLHGEEVTSAGAALLLMEVDAPYAVLKTCSFEATDKLFRIDRADAEARVVRRMNGEPAAKAYAAAVGVPEEALGHPVFMGNPLGLMIDGKPWVRSPVGVLPEGALLFGCRVLEGSSLYLLRSTDLVGDTRDAIAAQREELGGAIAGGLLFNCVHRRLEIEQRGLVKEFREAISTFPMAGVNTYGESWLGNMNQTLIGLLLG